MAKYKLIAEPSLGNYTERFDGVELREVVDLSLVSLALPLREEAASCAAIEKAFGIAVPEVGHSACSDSGDMRLLRVAQDQLLVAFPHEGTDAEPHIATKLEGAAYTTDQTHVWVMLEISGSNARKALERICPIDLDPDGFAVDQIARTSMEHLGTIIVRTSEDTFLMMSASSSAGSFLHAVETSIKNVT